MSLLITSNMQDEYSGWANNDGSREINQGTNIQRSSMYSNHLKNPLIIPPNSEIAVQSVKINRLPVFDITPANRFHFWLGDALEDKDGQAILDVKDTMSIPIPCNVKPGTYTSTEFRKAIQNEFNRAIGHPQNWQKTEVNDLFVNDIWSGFEYEFGSVALADGTNYAKDMASWIPWTRSTPAASATTWSVESSGTTKKIKRLKDNDGTGLSSECSLVATDEPMEIGKGACEIDLFDTYGKSINSAGAEGVDYRRNSSSFFFTRPGLTDGRKNPFMQAGETDEQTLGHDVAGFPTDVVPYGDYQVVWNKREDDEKWWLRLVQSVYDKDLNAVLLKDIEYWKQKPAGDNGGSDPVKAQITEDDLIDNTGSPDKTGYQGVFKVSFKGTGIKLTMQHYTKAGGLTDKIICDTTVSGNRALHEYCWTPINQNKWALYFGVSIFKKNHEIIVNEMEWNGTLNGANYEFGSATLAGSSWWSQATQNSGTRTLELCQMVEFRENQRMASGTTIHWRDLNTTGDALQNSRCIITSSQRTDTGTLDGKGVYYPAFGANMGAQLGFPRVHAVCSSQVGKYKKADGNDDANKNPAFFWIAQSSAVPELASHTAFIKCPNLTAQSYNFCKSIPSQILYHIPRFTNEGKQYGNLFWEVPEKTYVSLRNTDAIQLNQMDIQVVDKDEVGCRDLTGNTTIVFHIRSARM